MSAGQVWRRPDGLRWVEIQAAAVHASGWRLMVPLVAREDAPHAPPLVVSVDEHCRARVHLLTSAAHDELGTAELSSAGARRRIQRLQAVDIVALPLGEAPTAASVASALWSSLRG